MKKSSLYLLLITFTIITGACSNNQKSDNVKNDEKEIAYKKYDNGSIKTEAEVKDGIPHGILKNYTPDGYLESVYTMRDGKREGPSVHYYVNGQLKLRVKYVSNRREGLAEMFYKSGEIYRRMNYKDGKLQGIRKTYYKDGSIMGEAPYKDDFPGLGLKEYDSNGNLIKDEVNLRVTSRRIKGEKGKFIVEAGLSEPRNGVSFFLGELMEGQYLHGGLRKLMPIDGRVKQVVDVHTTDKARISVLYQTNKSNWAVKSKEIRFSSQ